MLIDIIQTVEVRQTKIYKKSLTKAKEVRFSGFRKKDLILSALKGKIEPPEVPQRTCIIDNIPNSMQ